MEAATIVDGNGTETGHIIVTTIGGKNGQPKQVCVFDLSFFCNYRRAIESLNLYGCFCSYDFRQ